MSITNIRHGYFALVLSAIWLEACGAPNLETSDSGDPSPGLVPSDPLGGLGGAPEPTSGGGACIISADCGPGTHCDLGECVQLCSRRDPCSSHRVCSPRGRCLDPADTDGDPEPSLDKAGQIRVTPAEILLTEQDGRLRLTLSTDSAEPVRYRVVPSAPYLSIARPRGEFVGDTVVELDVDITQIKGVDVAGTVRVLTNLGDVVVDAPLRVGLTGRYEGALRYSVGDVPLGAAQIVLDIREDLGDVSVKVDPERSLLFPAVQGEATFGEGIYTLSEGLEVTLTHTTLATTGGERNHFARDVGREVTLFLKPTAQGVFEGTFEERIFGVFEQPISVTGTVYLRTLPLRKPLAFESPAPRSMPTVSAGAFSTTGFDERMSVPSLAAVTTLLPSPCGAGAGAGSCLEQASRFFYGGLATALAGVSGTSEPLGDLSDVCRSELYVDVQDWASSSPAGGDCTNAGGLLAVLRELASSYSAGAPDAAALFHRTLARLLAPHLLIAQDDLVRGVRESFLGGLGDQVELYRAALSLLSAPARLALEPRVLEFLRRTSARDAAGAEGSADASLRDYPALRALGRLLYVLSSIEGELSSLSASDPTADRSLLLREAQEHAVLTVLEASALSALVEEWPSVPAGLGTELVGALTPLDQGFGTLLHGAVLFGVPEGEIPLAFDAARPQPTNFEQMLLLRASPALAQQAASQTAFLSAERDFEQSQDTLAVELERVRYSHEATITAICGPAFSFEVTLQELDWQECGADGLGSLAEAQLQIEFRQAEIKSAYGRIEGIAQRVAIEHQVLVETESAHDGTLRLASANGTERMALAEMENVINAAQIALEIASNSSLWNAGAPAAMGVVAGVLEVTKGTLQVRREELAMLQTMQAITETKQLEAIQSAARVKTLLIDAAQLEVDMEQLDIQLLQSSIAAANLLDTAKRSAVERERVLRRIQGSPAADPIYRTLMHDSLMQALTARREAQRWLYRSGRALEYETNTPFGDALGRAILAANNQAEISRLGECFLSIHGDYATEYGIPQEFKTTLSVRELLGVVGPRIDEVTGEKLDEGQLFRRVLLQNQNLDGLGGVGVEFVTNLEPGNGLWSSNVCSDKITLVRAKIVGDFLGDDEAELHLTVAGGGVLRACDGQLVTWSIDSPDRAIVQAGVNSFGAAAPNTTLHGHSVARPNWGLFIPGPDQAPANLDLDLERIDDIVLEVTHKALPLRVGARGLSLSCLGTIGSGG